MSLRSPVENGRKSGKKRSDLSFKILPNYGKRINNPNTHGTGCTLSSAIASNLAKGFSLPQSVKNAKDYISGALEAMLNLGKGSGPLMHNWNLDSDLKFLLSLKVTSDNTGWVYLCHSNNGS